LKTFRGDLELRATAMDARDALRARVVPRCRTLAKMLADRPDAARLVAEVEREAARHADRLRVAIKARAERGTEVAR
jgi:hypothetical protein